MPSFASLALILSAFEHGLAASFLGALDDEIVAGILDLPKDHTVVPLALVPIGYKSLEDKAWWDERSKKVQRTRGIWTTLCTGTNGKRYPRLLYSCRLYHCSRTIRGLWGSKVPTYSL